MFGFGRHRLVNSGILRGKTDIHCHVLPGVDDGSPDADHSLDLLDYMAEDLGFKEVWFTPHVMADGGNTAARLQARLDEFLPLYEGDIKIHLASEYMMDQGFRERLHTDPLRLGKSHLLVETSYMSGPHDLYKILEDVWNCGFHPLIAHPERYMYMDMDDYNELKSNGYEFQLNFMSLSGYYGPVPKEKAERFLSEGMYDFTGSDLHHLYRYEDYLYDLKLTRKQLDALERLLENNVNV